MRGLGRVGVLIVVFLALVAAGRGDVPTVPPPSASGSQEVDVVAVYLDPVLQAPKVILERKTDKRRFDMVIGLAEMNGIAVPLNGVTPPRPLTHDLFLSLFGRLKVNLSRVVINDLRDDIYYATLHLTSASGEMTMDSRPSDAIALAVRAKVPVLVEDRVFDKAGQAPGSRRPSI
ncbi:MAG TPA: bifunctional nuclease family protein [Methylomirabilota bacterium]|jgi:bifunctional DNase/RNase